jgi:hypothetical protein
MIGRLHGRLLEKNPPSILLDVGGVGYELDVPMSTLYALPNAGEAVTLLTHLAVREDAHQLYGFATAAERHAFRELIRISGIGARDHAAGERKAHTHSRHRQEDRRAAAAGTQGPPGCSAGRRGRTGGQRRQRRHPARAVGARLLGQGSDGRAEVGAGRRRCVGRHPPGAQGAGAQLKRPS